MDFSDQVHYVMVLMQLQWYHREKNKREMRGKFCPVMLVIAHATPAPNNKRVDSGHFENYERRVRPNWSTPIVLPTHIFILRTRHLIFFSRRKAFWGHLWLNTAWYDMADMWILTYYDYLFLFLNAKYNKHIIILAWRLF